MKNDEWEDITPEDEWEDITPESTGLQLGAGKATSIREQYPSEAVSRWTKPISRFVGMFSRKTGPGVALAAAASGAEEALRQGVQKFSGEPYQPIPLSTRARMVGSAAIEGAGGELLGRGMGAAGGATIKSLRPGFEKTSAQLVRAATGVPERDALAVIKDPSILSRAKSTKEAGELYNKAINEGVGYKVASGGEGSRAAFGKTMLSPEASINKFDELLPDLEAGKLDLQSAVSLRQTLSHHIAKGKDDWYVQPMRNALEQTDSYIETKLTNFPEALKSYREAKMGEEFGSWLPLNKNLSPNVLRTAGALGYAAHGVSEGKLLPSVMALGVSPKVWGYGLRAAGVVGKALPALVIPAKAGVRIGGSELVQSTEELLRKKYMENK